MLWIHTAEVETYLGATPTGDGYAAPVAVPGFLDDGVVLGQSPGGEQLSTKSVFFTDLDWAPVFVPQSKITVNGRVGQVGTVRRRDGGDILADASHLEVDFV